MDVADMVSDLGDHGFADTDSDTKLRMLQDTIWEIEGLHPWPFLETSINLAFDGTSGLATNFPTDYRAALKVKELASGLNLEPIALTDLEETVGTQLAQVAVPRVYYHEAEQMRLWPVPLAGTSVRLRYLKWSEEIDAESVAADILIPVRFHRVIVLGALSRLYTMEDEVDLGAAFEQQMDKRIERMVNDLNRKQYDRSEYIRVNDPDSWDY